MTAYLKPDHIDKHFDRAGVRAGEVLKGINLTISKGEFVSIIANVSAAASPPCSTSSLAFDAGLIGHAAGKPRGQRPGPERGHCLPEPARCPGSPSTKMVNLAVSKCIRQFEEQASERHDWVMANLDLVQMAHAKDKRPPKYPAGMKQCWYRPGALHGAKILLFWTRAVRRARRADAPICRMRSWKSMRASANTMVMITHDVDEAAALRPHRDDDQRPGRQDRRSPRRANRPPATASSSPPTERLKCGGGRS